MKKPENPPAFPYNEMDINSPGYVYQQFEGLSMRDYFAAKAMQRLLSEIDSERVIREQGDYMLRQVTEASYKVADAMLTEREKNQEQ